MEEVRRHAAILSVKWIISVVFIMMLMLIDVNDVTVLDQDLYELMI